MAEIEWAEAPNSVLNIARELIHKYHPELQLARIAFVFRSEAEKRGSRMILGQTTKIPDKMQPFLEYDYLIWLAEESYDLMTDAQREALIDHELTHCKRNFKTGTWSIREHDLQEFSIIVERHGMWSPDLDRVDRAMRNYQQLQFPDHTVEITTGDRVVSLTGRQLEQAAKMAGG